VKPLSGCAEEGDAKKKECAELCASVCGKYSECFYDCLRDCLLGPSGPAL